MLINASFLTLLFEISELKISSANLKGSLLRILISLTRNEFMFERNLKLKYIKHLKLLKLLAQVNIKSMIPFFFSSSS